MLPIIVVTDRIHLDVLIAQHLDTHGMNADLNHIDVSAVQDFDMLFANKAFNGNVSQWNMSNAITMRGMFTRSAFNGDLSKWDVSNVVNMPMLFAESPFNSNISEWNVSQVQDLSHAFELCPFSGDLTTWSLHPNADTAFCFAQEAGATAAPTCRLPIIPVSQNMEAFFGYENNVYNNWLAQAPGVNHWRVLIETIVQLEKNKQREEAGKPAIHWKSMDLDTWPHPSMINQWNDLRAVHEGLGFGTLESAQAMHRLGGDPMHEHVDLSLALP